jgi:hypothetical protein
LTTEGARRAKWRCGVLKLKTSRSPRQTFNIYPDEGFPTLTLIELRTIVSS